jgi:catechol 2,3-dioxygenase-like lactoylglutathione lyase family enzyme
MIEGISHVTLIVSDLERSARMLQYILGAEEVYSSGEEPHSISPEKFFIIGGAWVVLMQGEAPREKSYDHIAFKVAEADIDQAQARTKELGLETREDRPRIPGEGRSIYFYDYDNHLFELNTGSLAERLQAYRQDD